MASGVSQTNAWKAKYKNTYKPMMNRMNESKKFILLLFLSNYK